MKTLHSKFEEEEDELVTVASVEPTEPSGEKDGASTFGGGQEEEVVVQNVAK